MKIRRTVASVPVRSAEDTWATIVALVTRPESNDTAQLSRAASIMASIIADECAGTRPLIFYGTSQRLVIYCSYGADALELDEAINALSFNPTVGDWSVSAPCLPEDLTWMTAALEKRAPRIHVRTSNELEDDSGPSTQKSADVVEIDWSALISK